MKLRSITAALFGLLLFTNGFHVTLAQSAGNRNTEEVKAKVKERLTNGKTGVKAEKFDGTKIKGKLTQADETTFTIIESKTNQSTVIAFSDTKKLKGSGWPTSAKIAIGVGAAAAATFVILGIAFRNATRDN